MAHVQPNRAHGGVCVECSILAEPRCKLSLLSKSQTADPCVRHSAGELCASRMVAGSPLNPQALR